MGFLNDDLKSKQYKTHKEIYFAHSELILWFKDVESK